MLEYIRIPLLVVCTILAIPFIILFTTLHLAYGISENIVDWLVG